MAVGARVEVEVVKSHVVYDNPCRIVKPERSIQQKSPRPVIDITYGNDTATNL